MKYLLFITLTNLFNILAADFIYLTHFQIPDSFKRNDFKNSTIITKPNGSFVWGSEYHNWFIAVNDRKEGYNFNYNVQGIIKTTNVISKTIINGKKVIEEEQTDFSIKYKNYPLSILETFTNDGFQLFQSGVIKYDTQHIRIVEGGTPIIISKSEFAKETVFRRIVSYNKNGELVSTNMLNIESALSFDFAEKKDNVKIYNSSTEKTIIKAEFAEESDKKFVYFYVFQPKSKGKSVFDINSKNTDSILGDWKTFQNSTNGIDSIYFKDDGICRIIVKKDGQTYFKLAFYNFNDHQIRLFDSYKSNPPYDGDFYYDGESVMNYRVTDKTLTIFTNSSTNEFTIKK
jgi:hypothetical protein